MQHASSIIGTTALLLIACLLAGPSLAADNGHVDPALRQLLQQAINDGDSFEDRFDAEVWLVDMSHRLEARVPDPQRRLSLLKQIHYEATRADLWPELVLAVIEVESNFNRFAISSAGAMGLMQVMPFWLDEIGQPDDNLFDIQTNLRMGCTILKYYLNKEDGELTPALARYNGSYGSHRYTTRIYSALDKRWRRY